MTQQPDQDPVEHSERQRVSAPELSWAVRALVRAAAEVDRELARRLALRPLDYSALNHVMSGPAPLGSAELSGRLGISTGSATELVDRLEEAGHLHRSPHPRDRRRKVLEPTDAAVARTLGALQPLLERLDGLSEQFSPEDQAVIGRYLRAVTAHFHDFARATPAQDDPVPQAPKDTTP
ncbi:MarR family transcriptional regulator [Kocuria sediminis]|uniref:MarR family transcriptional regulator n=1 Tax=Kocuria sediminis TaxID=1038857 RepID=A0A6N8GNJ4_9MICC|nr:MarR family transcriptional regulator [Kocuria sediminis]MUN63752.1 MarR family transcriptional regulator [Kocuria sediminis]